jgi:hypothetical protein
VGHRTRRYAEQRLDAANRVPDVAVQRSRFEAAGNARRARLGRGFRHGWRGNETAHLTNEPPRRDP